MNLSDIRALHPCYDPVKYLPEDWEGTALDILKVEGCPAQDRLWVVLHEGWVTKAQAVEFACRCAERVLPIYEEKYPDDNRPRKAIEIARAYMRGEATREKLNAAYDDARDAALAARAAARAAAWAAWDAALAARDDAWDAPWDSAWDAAYDDAWDDALAARAARDAWDDALAARDSARDDAWDAAQIKDLIEILESEK